MFEIKGRRASFPNPKHPPPPPSLPPYLPPSVRLPCTDLTLNRKSFELRGGGGGGGRGALLPCEESGIRKRGRERLGRAWVRYHIPGAPDPKSAPSRLSGTCLCLFTTDSHRRPSQGRSATLQADQRSHLHLLLHLCSSPPSLLTSLLWKPHIQHQTLDPIKSWRRGKGQVSH